MAVTDYKYGMVSAYDYSVNPAVWTGSWSTSTDMTDQIQAFLNNSTAVPDGATAYIPPGTYKCGAGATYTTITCDRPINISAEGVTLNFGSSFDSASDTTVAFTFGKAASAGSIPTNLRVTGLQVVRDTPGSPASTDFKGVGLLWYGIQRCQITRCGATGFKKAHWCKGAYANGVTAADGQGNAYNIYEDLFAWKCKYAFYLEPGDAAIVSGASKSGWCNENVFLAGRALLDVTDPLNRPGFSGGSVT